MCPTLRKTVRPEKLLHTWRRVTKRYHPLMELLEDRTVPTTFTVNPNGSGDFTTIGAAVASASVHNGDTLQIAPGTYNEIISINKSLTLDGAQAGVDARAGRSGASESILSLGTGGVQLSADNITLDGFTIVNHSPSNGNGLIETFASANSFTLENTIVTDSVEAVTGAAILFGGGSHTNMLFSQDLFQDHGDATIYLGSSAAGDKYDGLHISDSKFLGLSGGLFYADGPSGNPLNNAVIQGNEFDGTVNGVPGVGDPLLNIGNATNLQITDNYFHDMDYTAFQVGMVGGSITQNTFSHIYADPGTGFGDDFQLWGGQFGTVVSTDVTIANNVINYNDVAGATNPTRGIRLRPQDGSSSDPGIDGTTIHINDNTFLNGGVLPNVPALIDQGDPTKPVDVSGNWWGTTDVPTIQSELSGPADFTPFLNSGTDTDPLTDGFQGDFSSLTVTAAGSQTGTAGRIQEAVNLATPGGTIDVLAGSYSEQLNVNKSVTLLGAQEGVDGTLQSGPATVLSSPAGGQTPLEISASDVTVNGFTVQGNTNVNQFGAGIFITPGVHGTQLLDNIVQNNITGLFVTNNSATDQAVIEHNLFQNNTQPGANSGSDIYADQFTAGVGTQNILIQSNTFTNTSFVEDSWGVGISNTDATPFTNIQVVGNKFTNSGRGVYFFNTTSSTVEGNTFLGMSHYAAGAFGGVSGLTVNLNLIENGGTGLEVSDEVGSDPNSGIVAHNNTITGNATGADVDPAGYPGAPLDASSNWWGSNTGPNNPSTNPAGLGDSALGNIKFTPFLTQHTKAPAITSAGSTTFTVGKAGTFTVTSSGVPTATLSSSPLPVWLTFTPNANGTGTLTGTPPTGSAGSLTITFSATNGISPDATQSFTLNVNGPPAISSVSGATFTVGQFNSFTVTTTPGFPTATKLMESGALPAGVSFVDNGNGTATLSGTPTTTTKGSFKFNIMAGNVVSTVSQAFTLTMLQAPAITSANTTTFTVGKAATFTVTSTGFPTATLGTSTLPAWLTFTANATGGGTLSGTPPTGSAGSYTITLSATNGVSPDAMQTFTLNVKGAPTITSVNSATFMVGQFNTFTVTTTPGFPTATKLMKSGSLPSGVTFIDNGNGTATLSGTPAASSSSSYKFSITATNSAAAVSQNFTLTMQKPPAITSPGSATFTVGKAGTFMVTSTGFPTATVGTGALPAWLTFTPNATGGGKLTGTPPTGSAGSYTITLDASNGISPDAMQTFTLNVNGPPSFTSGNSTTFTKNMLNAFTVTTTPGFPVTTKLTETGKLPTGVTFVDNGDGTGRLRGTPTVAGTFTFMLTASNGISPSATMMFTLTVA